MNLSKNDFRQAVRQELARRSLLDFTLYTKEEFDLNWHHEVVCEYLDKFVSLEIKRLMVFMPPRMSKSELVSRRLPAFIFGKNPNATIIAASYGADLARLMNRDVQRIMDHPLYYELFPDSQLFGTNVRTVASNTWLRNSDIFEIVGYDGYYRSAGVGGAITGMGFSYGIIDDPFKNRQDANSDIIRNSVWEWYNSTFYTRKSPDAGILLTMTRWHEDDLAGRLLAQAESDPNADQWIVVKMPAVAYEPIAIYDTRQEGDPLWPDRFDIDALDTIQANVGTYEWNALYQQTPKPREGTMFKREWFVIIDAMPSGEFELVRYWDKAGSQDSGAYTAGTLMAKFASGLHLVLDLVMGQWAAGERENVIKQTTIIDGGKYATMPQCKGYKVYVEQEPGSGGKESAENTIRNLSGFAVYADRPTGDKVVRADPLEAQASVGNVKLIKGLWNYQWLEHMTAFPYGKIKDVTDSSSGAFAKLNEPPLRKKVWVN